MKEKIDDIFIISELILKQLDGSITAAEQATLDEWLSDENNRRWYNNYILSRRTADIEYLNLIDKSEAWKNVSKQLNLGRMSYLRLLSYAAVVLAFIGISVVLYFSTIGHQKTSEVSQIAEIIPIRAGSFNADLVLSSGESMHVSASNDVMFSSDSSTMIISKDNTLRIEKRNDSIASLTSGCSYQTVNVSRGGEYIVALSDGTRIHLNSDTKLRFPSEFAADKRRVFVEGEAYFDVVHDANRPFIVSVGEIDIQVLGTKFNVKAYPEDECIYTTLVSGLVQTLDVPRKQYILLRPNEQSIYTKQTSIFEKRKVDASVYVNWTNGVFSFENEALKEIMKQMSRWYNVNVVFNNKKAENIRFTGVVDRFDNIQTILSMIEQTYDVKFTIGNGIITID